VGAYPEVVATLLIWGNGAGLGIAERPNVGGRLNTWLRRPPSGATPDPRHPTTRCDAGSATPNHRMRHPTPDTQPPVRHRNRDAQPPGATPDHPVRRRTAMPNSAGATPDPRRRPPGTTPGPAMPNLPGWDARPLAVTSTPSCPVTPEASVREVQVPDGAYPMIGVSGVGGQ
jgi:hypothetical protein